MAAIAAGGFAFRALSSLRRSSTEEAARLKQEAVRAVDERERLEFELNEWRDKAGRSERRVAELEEALAKALQELESAQAHARQEVISQRQFYARKARETFELLKHRLAADGFPDRMEALVTGARSKGPSEDARRLIKEMESWMEQGGVEDPNILHTLALIAYSRGDVKHAEARLRAAARVSADPLLHENLGDLLRATGRARRAVESYKNAAKMAPETSPIHRKLGLALFDAADYGSAVRSLTTALAVHPEDPDTHLKTARALLESGDFQKAVDVTQAASKRFSKNPLFPATAVVAFARMKRFKDSHKAYEKAVEIDPKSADAYFAHGFALLDEGKTAEARQAFQTALTCDAGRAEALYGLGLCAARSGDHEEALKSLEAAVERKPDYAEAWYAMKTSYEALKKFESAVEALNKAVGLNPRLSS